MDDLSVGPSVGRSVCAYVGLSSALWKNGGSDLDAIWRRRSDGSRQVVAFMDRSTGRGTFGGEFGARHCNLRDFMAPVCDNASTVGAAVWGNACGRPSHCCIRWGSRHARGRGGF